MKSSTVQTWTSSLSESFLLSFFMEDLPEADHDDTFNNPLFRLFFPIRANHDYVYNYSRSHPNFGIVFFVSAMVAAMGWYVFVCRDPQRFQPDPNVQLLRNALAQFAQAVRAQQLAQNARIEQLQTEVQASEARSQELEARVEELEAHAQQDPADGELIEA